MTNFNNISKSEYQARDEDERINVRLGTCEGCGDIVYDHEPCKIIKDDFGEVYFHEDCYEGEEKCQS
jgi:hypothetical protein